MLEPTSVGKWGVGVVMVPSWQVGIPQPREARNTSSAPRGSWQEPGLSQALNEVAVALTEVGVEGTTGRVEMLGTRSSRRPFPGWA